MRLLHAGSVPGLALVIGALDLPEKRGQIANVLGSVILRVTYVLRSGPFLLGKRALQDGALHRAPEAVDTVIGDSRREMAYTLVMFFRALPKAHILSRYEPSVLAHSPPREDRRNGDRTDGSQRSERTRSRRA